MVKLDWKTLGISSSVLAVFFWAWTPASSGADNAADAIPKVSIDDLLVLPDSLEMETSRRGGATRGEWHVRFDSARADVAKAEASLEEALAEMEKLAGESSNWKVASPFAKPEANSGGDTSRPLNYGLNQDIRRKRGDLERAERALLDLELGANLAGVPEAWHSSQ